jgi:hypothetical protein
LKCSELELYRGKEMQISSVGGYAIWSAISLVVETFRGLISCGGLSCATKVQMPPFITSPKNFVACRAAELTETESVDDWPRGSFRFNEELDRFMPRGGVPRLPISCVASAKQENQNDKQLITLSVTHARAAGIPLELLLSEPCSQNDDAAKGAGGYVAELSMVAKRCITLSIQPGHRNSNSGA